MEGWRPLAGLPPLSAAGKNAAYHWPSVANAALARSCVLFPTAPREQLAALAALEERLADNLRSGAPSGIFARSVKRGREVATALFEWSKSDGGHEGYVHNFPPYQPPVGHGL